MLLRKTGHLKNEQSPPVGKASDFVTWFLRGQIVCRLLQYVFINLIINKLTQMYLQRFANQVTKKVYKYSIS